MNRVPGLLAVVVLGVALAGCGSSDSPSNTPTATEKPSGPTDIVAIARNAGCVDPQLSPPSDPLPNDPFGPEDLKNVQCDIPSSGWTLYVSLYSAEAMREVMSDEVVERVCGLIEELPGSPTIHTVIGPDFTASVDAVDASDAEYEVQSKALADALDLPLTTTRCEEPRDSA